MPTTSTPEIAEFGASGHNYSRQNHSNSSCHDSWPRTPCVALEIERRPLPLCKNSSSHAIPQLRAPSVSPRTHALCWVALVVVEFVQQPRDGRRRDLPASHPLITTYPASASSHCWMVARSKVWQEERMTGWDIISREMGHLKSSNNLTAILLFLQVF